jgi:hypothetical protein
MNNFYRTMIAAGMLLALLAGCNRNRAGDNQEVQQTETRVQTEVRIPLNSDGVNASQAADASPDLHFAVQNYPLVSR